ncbi:MAG: type-F conjugative transfer system pilin assembly protein TrbC [Rickettsiaceae bacterium]|nr:type-F conjugative transfer system pilin assembly protein TrbC [Rickettsiaceae bacterium]
MDRILVILYGGSVIAAYYNMTGKIIITLISLLSTNTSFADSYSLCPADKKEITNEDFAKSLAIEAERIASRAAGSNQDMELESSKSANQEISNKIQEHNSNTHLMVFVSSSMSIELLKSYFKEASKFRGTLVFNGLPGESFKNLQNIIFSIQGIRNTNQIQNQATDLQALAHVVIDDESFKKYNITLVPSIVLSKEEECSSIISCPTIYDKVTGNIGIIGALRVFAEKGELRKESEYILTMSNHE